MSAKKTRTETMAAEAINRAKAHWGAGWANISEDMRQAYVAREVLKVIMGQDEDSMPPMMKRIVEIADIALAKSGSWKGEEG